MDGLLPRLQSDHRNKTGQTEIAQKRRCPCWHVTKRHVAAAIPTKSEACEKRTATTAKRQGNGTDAQNQKADQQTHDNAETVENEIGLVAWHKNRADTFSNTLEVFLQTVNSDDVARFNARVGAKCHSVAATFQRKDEDAVPQVARCLNNLRNGLSGKFRSGDHNVAR